MDKRKTGTLFLVTGLTILVFYLFHHFQPAITYAKCSLCDGNQYLKMYDFVSGKTSELVVKFPYYSRILVPALASLISDKDPFLGFQLVNLAFSIAAVLSLFYLWTRLKIPLYLITIGFFWLLFHWTGLIRLNIFDPITVDLPTYLFQTLLLLIIYRKRYAWLLILGPLAVLQRESITVLLLLVLAYEYFLPVVNNSNRQWNHLRVILLAILITILVKFLFTHFYPPIDSGKSSVRLVLFYIKEILLDPFKMVRWLVGVFMAFGGLLMLALVNVKDKWKSHEYLIITLFSGVYILLGLIAGGDSTRIVFLGFPFIMTWILLQLKNLHPALVFMSLGLSIFQMRLFAVIPDPGIDFGQFASWYPEFASVPSVLAWLAYFFICFVLMFIMYRLFPKKAGFHDSGEL